MTEMQEDFDLSKILRRVQQFINMAEGSNNNVPDSPEWIALDTEQKLARERADALMLQYAITEAMAEAAKPITERMKPKSELFDAGKGDLANHIDRLADMLARFSRVKIRTYAEYDRERRIWMSRVYGYESDVRYFTFLYTTLRLHMIGALRPEIDPKLSQDENIYNLHSAGMGWREMARLYGWKEERGIWYQPNGERWEGETRLAMRQFRLAYYRECKKRGETPVTNINSEGYRADAAQGYLARIHHRLREVEAKRLVEGGSALALRVEDIEQFVREESGNCYKCPACGKLSLWDYRCDICGNTEGMAPPPPEAEECPKCKAAKSGTCRDHHIGGGRIRYRKFNGSAYDAGVKRANSANLGGQNVSHTNKSIN